MRKYTPTHAANEAPVVLPGSTAVIIGRWQPFHLGHETLLNAALATSERVVVVICAAFRARESRNPFTWQERQAMVQACLTGADLARVRFLPVRDYFDDERWSAAVSKGVDELIGSSGTVHGPTTVVDVKDANTGVRLDHFPSWRQLDVLPKVAIDGTSLRNVFFEASDPDARLAVMAPFVSQPVLNYLQAWARLPAYIERVRDHLAVVDYRKKWSAPSYLTADAVVVASKHVLLVRRASDIGHGLWALPGGFVAHDERFYSAAVRELAEVTGFEALPSSMKAAFKDREIFDHPHRSNRGRLITNAFYFNFGNMRLPEVQGGDDALQARWTPIAELPQMEDKMFEDHAAIIDRFVGMYRQVL